jgi:acyl-ACP thioesterase
MRQEFITAVDEFDYREILKPSAVMQYFQDLATSHASALGIGYDETKAKNLCWVITRLSFKIERMPALGDKITVTTYPMKPRMADVNRDYYITEKGGKQIISGTSKWCVIDFTSKAVRRVDSFFAYADSDFYPDAPFADGNPKLPPLGSLGATVSKPYGYTVKITDLDRNVHMNNARYGDLILNSCTTEELKSKYINSFEIHFITELRLGDEIEMRKAESDGFTYYEAVRVDDCEKIVFRARAGWINR